MAVVLLALSGGYGYHRDELYFLAAGRNLAWGYDDQGPLVPLIARAMSEVAPGSLLALRLPAALAAGLTVVLTGALAREFGGGRVAQAVAVACAGVSTLVLFTGHLLSTSTFDLLAWTALCWLVVRAVRGAGDRHWLGVGMVLGIALLNKPLPAFLALALLAAVALVGPRRVLRSPPVWAAAAIAAALWSPWLIWQASHGWPQLDVSSSIAAGQSTSSQPWWALVPFQALLAGPLLAPVWVVGLVRLFRDPSLRDVRFLGWAWVLLAVAFMLTGGKPYYLAGLLPVLLAAGAAPVERWLARGRVRRPAFAATVAVSAVVGGAIALPVLPAEHAGVVVAANPDVGETIGWPELVATVARVRAGLPPGVEPVVLTRNYGQAGAVDRFGPARGLPPAYSGHNAYGRWGPPPDGAAPVIAVGLPPADLARLTGCREAARVENDAGIDNDERGRAIVVCAGPAAPWSQLWPAFRRLG